MTDEKRSPGFAFPLLVFAASRALLALFSLVGPLFGPAMGTPDAALARWGPKLSLAWVAMAHGEVAGYARVARAGYRSVADGAYFPLVPLVGKLLGAVFGRAEPGLFLLSLLACAAGFVGVYRVFAQLRNVETARSGVLLLAAFPFSYHLSDGSALACLLAFSVWGSWLALRGSLLGSTLVFAVGALAHPWVAIVGLAAPALHATGLRQAGATSRPSWLAYLAMLAPVGVVAGFMLYLHQHVAAPWAALGRAWLGTADGLRPPWPAMLLAFGAVLAVGGLLAVRRPGERALALVGGACLGLAMVGWSPTSTVVLAACWPLFLGLGDLLAERQALRIPAVAMLTAHQGLLLYCFSHFLGRL